MPFGVNFFVTLVQCYIQLNFFFKLLNNSMTNGDFCVEQIEKYQSTSCTIIKGQ